MSRQEEKEKLMNEVFSKKRTFSNIYNDSLDVIKQTEDELNKILMENQKSLEAL